MLQGSALPASYSPKHLELPHENAEVRAVRLSAADLRDKLDALRRRDVLLRDVCFRQREDRDIICYTSRRQLLPRDFPEAEQEAEDDSSVSSPNCNNGVSNGLLIH